MSPARVVLTLLVSWGALFLVVTALTAILT